MCFDDETQALDRILLVKSLVKHQNPGFWAEFGRNLDAMVSMLEYIFL